MKVAKNHLLWEVKRSQVDCSAGKSQMCMSYGQNKLDLHLEPNMPSSNMFTSTKVEIVQLLCVILYWMVVFEVSVV